MCARTDGDLFELLNWAGASRLADSQYRPGFAESICGRYFLLSIICQ